MTTSTGGPAQGQPAGQRLADDLGDVVRMETERLRDELTATARRAGTAGVLLAGAGVCGLLALGTASAAALRLLDTVLPRRLSALGLTGGYLLGAAVLGFQGLIRLRAAGTASQHLAEQAGEDVAGTARGVRAAVR